MNTCSRVLVEINKYFTLLKEDIGFQNKANRAKLTIRQTRQNPWGLQGKGGLQRSKMREKAPYGDLK